MIKPALCTALLLLLCTTYAQAQDSPPSYKDIVAENPEPEADMQVAINYVQWCVAGEFDQLRGILADGYMNYGPGPSDSLNTEQLIATWKANGEVQSNREVGQITQTWRVLAGDLKGDWVSLWGTYNYTQAGQDISVPFQLTANVTDEGQLARTFIYYDQLPIAMKLGFTLTPPQKEEEGGGN